MITWRDTVIGGQRCWLRRARYVAREYAWLSPERQDLFSPASSNVTNRLMPSIFLHWKKKYPEKKFVLGAIDIGDAFLTVPQLQPTLVTSDTQSFALGRVLPGQRDGSQLWFESVTNFLHEKLGFEHCSAYPGLLRSPRVQRVKAEEEKSIKVHVEPYNVCHPPSVSTMSKLTNVFVSISFYINLLKTGS